MDDQRQHARPPSDDGGPSSKKPKRDQGGGPLASEDLLPAVRNLLAFLKKVKENTRHTKVAAGELAKAADNLVKASESLGKVEELPELTELSNLAHMLSPPGSDGGNPDDKPPDGGVSGGVGGAAAAPLNTV